MTEGSTKSTAIVLSLITNMNSDSTPTLLVFHHPHENPQPQGYGDRGGGGINPRLPSPVMGFLPTSVTALTLW